MIRLIFSLFLFRGHTPARRWWKCWQWHRYQLEQRIYMHFSQFVIGFRLHLFIRVLCKCIECPVARKWSCRCVWGQKLKGKRSSRYTKHCVRPELAESLPRESNLSFQSSQLQPFTQITSRCHNTTQKYTWWSGILQLKRGVRRNTAESALMFCSTP